MGEDIWRIPVDEIDRPGSFASHMNRSIVLLLNVLYQLKDYNTLLKVSSMLQRTPDHGKKYLRDADRQVLAQRAFVPTVLVLEDMLDELTEISNDPDPKSGLLGAKMTTDISEKVSTEESQEAFPSKTILGRGGGVTVEEATTEQPPPLATAISMDTMEPQEAKQDTTRAEMSASRSEPMDFEDCPEDPEKTDTQPLKSGEVVRGLTSWGPKEKFPESRTPELSLEELSISSSRHHPPQLTEGAKVHPHHEESIVVGPPRPTRKRKLMKDTESGKTLLLDTYRVWQQGQKVMTYDLGKIEKIMSETYMIIKQVDEEAALEQAVKFSQVHIGGAAQKQSTGETPTTPKHPRDPKESCFPTSTPASAPASAPPLTLTPPAAGSSTCGVMTAAEPLTPKSLLRPSKEAKMASLLPSSSGPSLLLLLPPRDRARLPEVMEETPPTAGTVSNVGRREVEEEEEEEEEEEGKPKPPLEGPHVRQDPHLCQPAKTTTTTMAAVVATGAPGLWQVELEVVTGMSTGGQMGGRGAGNPEAPTTDEPGQAETDGGNQAKSRSLASMPKLFIPSSATKFPPEITVTPPTPTLLFPKGSISEETKQKLKSAILSAQSAANVKKETLCQPALEIVETSSQESSLESETDEEDDYMDI